MILRALVVVAVLGMVGSVIQTVRLQSSNSRLAVSDIQLQACGLRLGNLIRDLERDNAVDNISDFDLRNVPSEWLLPDSRQTVPAATD